MRLAAVRRSDVDVDVNERPGQSSFSRSQQLLEVVRELFASMISALDNELDGRLCQSDLISVRVGEKSSEVETILRTARRVIRENLHSDQVARLRDGEMDVAREGQVSSHASGLGLDA